MLAFHFIFALLLFSSRLHCSVSLSRSSVCSHHPTVYLTACTEHGHLIRIPSHCLLMLTHSHTFYCRNPRFFALLLLCGDFYSDSHHPDLFCLTETWIKHDTTPAELINCTPLSYSLLSFPRNSSANRHHPTGGGTAFLIREPFAQLSSSTP